MFAVPRRKRKQCVFCDIGDNYPDQKASRVLFRNQRFYVIEDAAPATDIHLLAIPRRHIVDANDLKADDAELVLQMQAKLRELLADAGYAGDSPEVSVGFHLPPFISVGHLHMHGMAPIGKLNWLGRWKYHHNNRSYCSVKFAVQNLTDPDYYPGEAYPQDCMTCIGITICRLCRYLMVDMAAIAFRFAARSLGWFRLSQ